VDPLEDVLSSGGFALRFLGKVKAIRSKSGNPADMEEVELDLGKGLESPPTGKVPTTPSSDEEIAVFPVRSPKVRFMSLGVKKPANPLQLLVLTCAAKPPPGEGFCPKAAPQQRDWGWGGSLWEWEWEGEAENPPTTLLSDWGRGGGAEKSAVGSYFL